MEKLQPFSKRETEIIEHLLNGNSSKEIAFLLHISEFTVKAHRRRIMEKSSSRNCAQLFNFFRSNCMYHN